MATQNSLPRESDRPLKTVLIGTSLGEESDQVVGAGLAVARAAGAQVYLVHGAELERQLIGYEAGVGPIEQELLGQLGEELRRQVQRLGLEDAALAGARVVAGAPHRVLSETAKQVDADLIVVGATGSGPFAAELLGSTADKIVRKALCPVLIVREGLQVPPRKVLAPVDLSALSGDTLRCGLHLLAQLTANGKTEVRAMHALSLLDTLAVRQKTGRPVEQIESSAREELRRFVRECRADAIFHMEPVVFPGEARWEILHDLEEHPVDLVILGTHGRGGLDRLVLGSVASTVARKAPCSVLVIPAETALEEGIADAIESQAMPCWHQEPVAAGT